MQAPRRRPRGRGLEAARRRASRARVGSRAGAAALGSGPPADRPWRLAGARPLGRRHHPTAVCGAGCVQQTEGGWTVAVPEAPPQRLDARGSTARRARRRQQRAGTARAAAGRARAARAPDPDRRAPGRACTQALRTLKQSLYPYQRDGVERFSRAGGACSLPTTWGSARPRRRSPPATPSGTPAASAVASSSSPPRSSRSGCASGSSSPTRPPPSSTAPPPSAARRSRRAAADSSSANYEQLIRDLDVVRDWTPDIVVLDEAQRIKNWATKTALTVKRLDPPYRLVLTGTPMENRLDELASIVEWVDDLALEPKWRLARVAHHARGRKDGDRRRPEPRHAADPSGRLHGPARAARGALAAARADRHADSHRDDRGADRRARRAQPCRSRRSSAARSGGRSRRRSSCG